jgi:hypothetical protein
VHASGAGSHGNMPLCVCLCDVVPEALFKKGITTDQLRALWRLHVKKACDRSAGAGPNKQPNGAGDALLSIDPVLLDLYGRIAREKNARDHLKHAEKTAAEEGKRLREHRSALALQRTAPRIIQKVWTWLPMVCLLCSPSVLVRH